MGGCTTAPWAVAKRKNPGPVPRVLRPRGGRIRIPPPMARAPIEGPEQLFHFAEAAVPATTLPAFEPVRVVAEPVFWSQLGVVVQ